MFIAAIIIGLVCAYYLGLQAGIWGGAAALVLLLVGAAIPALSMYAYQDTNGTEIRAYAGNFLFSTGANEFAGRFTEGHFDIPVRGCTISLDGRDVVVAGQPVPLGEGA